MINTLVLIIASSSFLFFSSQERRTVLSADVSLSAFVKELHQRIPLKEADLDLADSLASIYVRTNHAAYPWTRRIDRYEEYYRQYAGFGRVKNEKVVFINAFIQAHNLDADFLKENIIQVKGGGSGYFTLKIDLHKKECFDLKVNAPK